MDLVREIGFVEADTWSSIVQTFNVGTRGSGLALWQTNEVIGKLTAVFPSCRFHPVVIRTTGDVRTDVPLAAVGSEGVFVKELEAALERGEVDLAVHSLKDLPTQLAKGMELPAILPRVDARDALVAHTAKSLSDLPDGAIIGTGSLRRRAQLAMINPRWEFRDVRGNLETRLGKLDSGKYDALILACAGLDRLGFSDRITQRLAYSTMLSAPGQASVAIETRQGDGDIVRIVSALDDAPSRAAVEAERALLREVEGGCQVPLGAHAEVVGDHLILEAIVASLDGTKHVRMRMEGPLAKPEALGITLGLEMLAKGGREILDEVRSAMAQAGTAGEIPSGGTPNVPGGR